MEHTNFADLQKGKSDVRNTHINIGTGKDISIKELATMVQEIIGFEGEIVWDDAKPDGTPRKLLDVSKLQALGWKERVGLEEGIETVYKNNFTDKIF
jgi:GDP-L-fucose synthase